jgi:hypothetical protein
MDTNATSPDRTPEGSSGIPGQGSEGNGGSVGMGTNPCQPPQGTDKTGKDNHKPHTAEKSPVRKPVKKVFRKTELHGTGPATTPEERDRVRRKTIQNLKEPGAEISYIQFETAFKDYTCSLIERQDRIRDELFFHVADLQQQLSDLEEQLAQVAQERTGKTGVGL